jgi:hypothetical protein
LEAMALILVALGAVYIYRSTPEMGQAPRPPAVTERAPRGRGAAQIAGTRQDLDETTALKQSAVKTEASLDDQAEREAFEEAEPKALKERDVGLRRFGVMRKEAPSSSNVAPLVRELTLKAHPHDSRTGIPQVFDSCPRTWRAGGCSRRGQRGETLHTAGNPDAPSSPRTLIR